MKIFYTGGNGPFMGSRAAGFSLATLQRDWWFGFTPENGTRAIVQTVPVVVGAGGQLRVSADARHGAVAVGVVGHAALSPQNCAPLRGNLTEAAVAWKADAAGLAPLVGQNVSLEFWVERGAVLFAFDL